MKSTAWLRVGVVFVVLMGSAGALLRWALHRPDDDLKGLALNLVTELAGAAVVYFLFELVIERMERGEAEKKALEGKKAALIAQMGSKVHDVAIAAAEELRRHGWLTDGSLQGANLRGANLQGAALSKANLQGARLLGANLQEVLVPGGALLPDGTEWTLYTDTARFTDFGHPDFWRPDA